MDFDFFVSSDAQYDFAEMLKEHEMMELERELLGEEVTDDTAVLS